MHKTAPEVKNYIRCDSITEQYVRMVSMFNLIRDNIKNFLDVTVFLAMIGIGLFTILSDYRYFKKTGFRKDAAVTLAVGVAYIVLPFALFLISRL